MPELKGFMVPRTPEGRSSVVPRPPWHYSGDVLTIEYRAEPARVAALLPDGVDLAEEDPGAVAIIWADWQSCSDSQVELLDPVRSQYKECFVVIRCRYNGEHYSRCVYIWVDKDFALARGWYQGYPKKLGSIWMTRPVTVGKAGPRFTFGPYGVIAKQDDPNKVSFLGTRGGVLLGYEQPIVGKLSFVADWFSGKNFFGYFTPGISVALPHSALFNIGYSIGNERGDKDYRNQALFAYYGIILN